MKPQTIVIILMALALIGIGIYFGISKVQANIDKLNQTSIVQGYQIGYVAGYNACQEYVLSIIQQNQPK